MISSTADEQWGKETKVKFPEGKAYTYRYYLKDKKMSSFQLSSPEQFLSPKSLERRKRQHIQVDSTDLPVCKSYLQQFKIEGVTIIGCSKWNNTIIVTSHDTLRLKSLSTLPCVKKAIKIWESTDSIKLPMRGDLSEGFRKWDSIAGEYYGVSHKQIEQIQGIRLHEEGFLGKGMTIAVLDGGFRNVDRIPVMRDISVVGTKDFIYPQSKSIFHETDHGTKVLSILGAYAPNVYIGTAPDAHFWLLRCEDQQSEQPIEEDYWAMAAEFADSVGVDIINSSLGYNEYDHHFGDHKYFEMNGQNTLISHTASLLSRKGILLVCSAGNSGMGQWKKITFPADADGVLAVGAVTASGTNAAFSSIGPTQDGRIKPDVMALGSPTFVISGKGNVTQDMGTSFAAPLICGMAACLWQSMPDKTANEIIDIIRRYGNNAQHPDNIYGYGIPDFWKAWKDNH